jgi:hypothetical protein
MTFGVPDWFSQSVNESLDSSGNPDMNKLVEKLMPRRTKVSEQMQNNVKIKKGLKIDVR